jgi:hypothetical protein
MHGCLHYFCKECFRDYTTDLITRGEVGVKMICPDQSGCRSVITEHTLQQSGVDQSLIDKLNVF